MSNLKLLSYRSLLLSAVLWLQACATVAVPVTDTVPIDAEALAAQATAALQAGQFRVAADLYRRAAQVSDDEEFAAQATRVTYEYEQNNAALASAQRWLSINSTNLDAHRYAGFAALKLYDIDAAATHVTDLLQNAYISPTVGFIELLPVLKELDAAPAVTAMLQHLAEQFDALAEAHYALADFALRIHNNELALTEAQRAHQLAPYWTPAAFLLAQAQIAKGQTEAALTTAQAALDQDGDVAQQIEYANLLQAVGHTTEARTLLNELIQQEDVAAAVAALAQLEYQAGRFEVAFRGFERLLQQEQYAYEALFYMGHIAERAGMSAKALQFYSRITEGEFELPAQLRVARITFADGDLAAALRLLEDFGAANSEFALTTVNARAELLQEAGDAQGALTVLEEALSQYGAVTNLRIVRALQLLDMGRLRSAVTLMRELVAARPEDPIVLNMLGFTLVDQSRKYREGYQFIQHAYQYMPDNPAVLDSMGWALYKLGRAQEALDYMQRAARVFKDPEVALHLGDVLWALQRRQEALQVWQAGSQSAPKNAALQKRLQRHKTAQK